MAFTKESLNNLWNNLWDWRTRINKESTITIGDEWVEVATQKNKPSAHSSLDLTEARAKLSRIFPEPDYKIFFVANTNSMEPFIDQNSVCVFEDLSKVKFIAKQPLVKGDICVYESIKSNKLIIHRITDVNLDNSKYKFFGDNNFFSDGWIDKEQIKYRYIGQLQTREIDYGD